jgi:hypothetical protein
MFIYTTQAAPVSYARIRRQLLERARERADESANAETLDNRRDNDSHADDTLRRDLLALIAGRDLGIA